MGPAPRRVGGANVPVWNKYSVAERDRRWAAVRANAAKAGFDCTFVPLGNGTDARYLTQLRCSSIVLPTDGRPPIVIADRGSTNEWVPEPRLTSREWAEPMAQTLLDLGMERARIGVVGLKIGTFTHVRAFDGVVNHSSLEHVRRRLPQATFEDATDVVGSVRYVKSQEEIECLERSSAIAEAGVEEMIRQAQPGADAAALYARVVGAMLRMGSEYHPLALYVDDIGVRNAQRHTQPPIGKRLAPNTLITNEVSAVWGTQVSQEDQPILLGPLPDAWKPVVELQAEVFEAGLQMMKPGLTLGELADFVDGFGSKRGLRTATLMHGRGAGDDGPLISPRAAVDRVREVRLEAGTAWVWKPYAMTADGTIEFVWGGDVVVTEAGGRRLFKRAQGMVAIE